jgi:hypothetical protein
MANGIQLRLGLGTTSGGDNTTNRIMVVIKYSSKGCSSRINDNNYITSFGKR